MEKKKPVKKIRIGKISAAIWDNQTEKGIFYNVTFDRTYYEGTNARSTDSFGQNDLLLLKKVSDMAFNWIVEKSSD